MNFLLAAFLIPWLSFTSPAGNQIGSFVANQPYPILVLLCETTATEFERTGTIQCKAAIPFPTPEGLR